MSTKIKIAGVVGARPNFMKIGPLSEALRGRPDRYEFVLVHTGQHYDEMLNEVFFRELGLPRPDVHLGVGSGSHGEQTARIMLGIEKTLSEIAPHLVVVVGDVNSTLAASLVASKLGIAVAHVEAGLRSRDRRMPEEINRIVTDHLSDILYTPTGLADENLLAEGIPAQRICLVGNIMIDTLIRFLALADKMNTLGQLGLVEKEYGLVTLHRPSNVDDPAILAGIVEALVEVSSRLTLVFPAHPRTVKMLNSFGLAGRLESAGGIRLVEPLGYLDFLRLMKSARLVLSDSGGIQEETTYLKVPCLTLRENTERPETLRQGTNVLVGSDRGRIVEEAFKAIRGESAPGGALEFWDGRVASRIVQDLESRRDYLLASPDERTSPEALQVELPVNRGET
ncbi:MAG: UDP-N-acetylglucosamine 2-epimerase (non-hydrolyzing) [Candidatus Glassbacteria bacterium]